MWTKGREGVQDPRRFLSYNTTLCIRDPHWKSKTALQHGTVARGKASDASEPVYISVFILAQALCPPHLVYSRLYCCFTFSPWRPNRSQSKNLGPLHVTENAVGGPRVCMKEGQLEPQRRTLCATCRTQEARPAVRNSRSVCKHCGKTTRPRVPCLCRQILRLQAYAMTLQGSPLHL